MTIVAELQQIGIPIKTQRLRRNMEAVFRCRCGKKFVTSISSVKSGKTRSCGCLKKELTSLRTRRHGKSRSKIYHVWHNMMRRCHDSSNKRFKDWGGRGIFVDAKWHTFEAFFLDVGDVPFCKAQIDRIDNNRGYEPGNIRWVTHTENNANTRRSRFVKLANEVVCIAEAARRIGMSRHELRHKLNRGVVPVGISCIQVQRADKE
jgi:hypothetical protein